MTEVERADERPGEARSETENPARASEGTTGRADPEGGGPEGGVPDGGERPARRGRRRITELAVVAAVAYALDLITKILVVEKLEGHAPIEVIGTWLRFQAVRNPGAAFGIGEALTIVFTLIAAIVIVVIMRIARKLYSTPWAVALGLLLGGALGNLTDRVFRSPGLFQGHVVDFIAPAHFAVFNLADSAIVCGGVLIVLLSFRGLDPDGSVHRD
ncbi:signal peptidase II [Streptomyces taklimakanensis]|uniref:signal peptidase II n=1 Tax=Streptomyces taklimakanensis TaxID=2569853 RepID=UPI003083FE97